MSQQAGSAHPPSSHPHLGVSLPLRATALHRATDVHTEMLRCCIELGVTFEDRNQPGCHIYLGEATPDRMWNLSISIDFNPHASIAPRQESAADRPNVCASLNLIYGRKTVYQLMFDGRHNFWRLSFEHDEDDSPSWNQLPHREDIINQCLPTQEVLVERWRQIVGAVAMFYLAKLTPSTHMTTNPPPPSMPPLAVSSG